LHTETTTFQLGENHVSAVSYQSGSNPLTFLNVHDDEDTSVAAGKACIAEKGGRLIELSHSGERFIRFNLANQRYAFDPNRIFSDFGIEATLKKNGAYSPKAHEVVRLFATDYLTRFDLNRQPVIVALHNTVDGIFSVESFQPSAEHGSASKAIHISAVRNKFDFYFVTDDRFFSFLSARGFNVVLQDNETVSDDGSLSVHFSKLGIPYINVEAEMRHLDEQIQMLRVMREMLEVIPVGIPK